MKVDINSKCSLHLCCNHFYTQLFYMYKLAVLLLIGIFATSAAIAQKPDRFLQERAGDSMWMVQRVFARNRFYIGDKQVHWREWRSHLQNGDKEVGEMVDRAIKLRRTGNWIGITSAAAFVGALIAIPARSSYNNNDALFSSLLITGLAASIVAEVYYIKSWRLYSNSVRLFNNKANSGKLQPLTLQLQLSPVHAGLALRW